jgi:hypothetical protein
MTDAAQLALFLSSYAPLFGVFALLESFGEGWPVVICVILACAGPLVLGVMLLIVSSVVAPQELRIDAAQTRDADALAYVATYLVPFAAIAATTPREQGALALFVLLIAVVYIRSELFYVNPLLAAAGYRLFQVTTPKGASVVVIARRRFLPSATSLNARRLSSYVYWEARQ